MANCRQGGEVSKFIFGFLPNYPESSSLSFPLKFAQGPVLASHPSMEAHLGSFSAMET